MLVVYLRSSSIGTFKLCEFDYYLTYELGLDKPSGKAARIGNCVHKALELLARKKLALQNGLTSFVEPESNKTFNVLDVDNFLSFEFGMSAYDSSDFTAKDIQIAEDMYNNTLVGPYDPMKQKVVEPELFFDMEISEPWAHYQQDNPYTGKIETGNLRIRGTMDLITEGSDGILHYIDWKTGRRWDWAKNKVKNLAELMDDDQLLLYYFALRNVYKNKEVQMTIHFLKDGGPFTLPYGDEEYEKAKLMIKKHFKDILKSDPPKRLKDGKTSVPLACRSFCYWGKTLDENGVSLCDKYHNSVQQLGIYRVTEKYGKKNSFDGYSGGGVQNREAKE